MQSKPKSNSIVTSRIPEDMEMIDVTVRVPRQMVFAVRDAGEFTFNLSLVSAENMGRACVHGWNQRIPDGAAVPKSDKYGRIIPEAERTALKHERMLALRDHYETGTEVWERKSTGGTGGGRSLTIEAIARVKGVDYAEAERLAGVHAEMHFKGDRKKALAHLATGKRVAQAMLDIRTERLSLPDDAPDADEMLDEMPSAE